MGNNYNHLTIREIEILLEIAKGCKGSEIGKKLFISSRTVGTHKVNICKKLNLKSTVELICFATANRENLEKTIELIFDLSINLEK